MLSVGPLRPLGARVRFGICAALAISLLLAEVPHVVLDEAVADDDVVAAGDVLPVDGWSSFLDLFATRGHSCKDYPDIYNRL